MEYDTIVVGQGIAGATLAWKLLQAGQRVLIIDNKQEDSASRVAAGLLNPITGKRLAKSWLLDETLPIAIQFYEGLETTFNTSLITHRPILRILQKNEDFGSLCEKFQDDAFKEHIGRVYEKGSSISSSLNLQYGAFEIKQACILDTGEFLNRMQAALEGVTKYIREPVQYEELKIASDTVRWREFTAKRIIFCEGYKGATNPFFSWLPWKLAKGEFIKITNTELADNSSYNHGFSYIPSDNKMLRIGATYAWDAFNSQPTESAKEKLLQGYRQFITVVSKEKEDKERSEGGDGDPVVMEHLAGVRPCTQDAKPFIGAHPAYPAVFIFNGFGSKGTLHVPYFADELIEVIEKRKSFNLAVDIQRYIAAYYKES